MSAIFTLENGFDPDSGKAAQNGRLFGRQAFVGLSDVRYGTLTLGRQYDFMSPWVGALTSSQQYAGFIGTRPSDIDGLDGSNRTSNSVKYTATMSDFQFGVMYAFGGVAGSLSQDSMVAAGATYAHGPINLAAAFSNYRNPAATIFDGASPVNGVYTNPVSSPTQSGYSSAQRMQISALAGTYAIGQFTIGLNYSNIQYQGIVPTATTSRAGSAKFNTYEGFATYSPSSFWRIGAGYNYTKGDTAHYGQAMAGAMYFLSKRTSLWGAAVYQHASGIGSNGLPAVALITQMSPSSTANQLAVHVGIVHRF
jgi:predicted porin